MKTLAAQPKLTAADIRYACSELGCSRSQAYKLISRYRADANCSVEFQRKRGASQGASLIQPEVDKLIREVVHTHYLTRQKLRVSRIMRTLFVEAKKRSLKCPSRGAVQRRINQIDPKTLLTLREGSKIANNKMSPVVGSLTATRPLEVVQVDHTPADVIVVDDDTRQPLQRPWLTLLIDVATRMIVGYYLSLESPSTTSVALALQHAVLPKDDWLKTQGIGADWPVSGLPEKLHMDNGREFHSTAFTKGLRDHGISHYYRPVKRPKFGGHIERLIGTIMWGMHDLPGTTFSNIQERGTYASEKRAVMTLAELDHWLAVYITEYHHRVHSALLRPPIAVWNELAAAQGNSIRHPKDRDQFYLDFLPVVRRLVRRDGIRIGNIFYWDDVLSAWAARSKTKYWIRYDPRNMGAVYFQSPDKKFWRIRTRNLARPHATLAELKQARKRLREQGRSEVDESLIFDALETQRLIVEDAAQRTAHARRKKQRATNALRQSALPSKNELLQPPEAVSDDPAVPFEIEEWQ